MTKLFLLLAIGVVAIVLVASRLRRDERVALPAGTASTPTSVESLMQAGRKIEAIKLLREETGLGLKEAKEEVERRMRHGSR